MYANPYSRILNPWLHFANDELCQVCYTCAPTHVHKHRIQTTHFLSVCEGCIIKFIFQMIPYASQQGTLQGPHLVVIIIYWSWT